MKARPFAYNSSGNTYTNIITIIDSSVVTSGLSYTRYGDSAPEIDTNIDFSDLEFWNGPDEDIYHVIGIPVPTGDQPTPTGGTASVGFYGSDKNESAFIALVNSISGENYTTIGEAKKWVSLQGYWTSYRNDLNWKLDCGLNHTLEIDQYGQVWGWGRNNYGQLGNGTNNDINNPDSILGSKKTFCQIVAVNFNSLGIDYTGQLWGWGNNLYGQLGINSTGSTCTPVSILGTKKTFCAINSGYYHSISIDHQGQVWSWGRNNYGQLGINSTGSTCTPVSMLGNIKTFCSISASADFSIGIDYTGQVWSWGRNLYGQLGVNSTASKRTPVSVCGGKKTFCSIDCGNTHSIGIDYMGQVWGWGNSNYGQLGVGNKLQYITPVSIIGTKKTFCSIGAGSNHSHGIDYQGQVWGWGNSNYGQLGVGTNVCYCTPVSIGGTKKTFCSISVGYSFVIGIDQYGQNWGWGDNRYYSNLGRYYVGIIKTPFSITGTKKTFCSIGAGTSFSLGIDYQGQLWGWGYNNDGQLGNNSVVCYSTPVSICGAKKTFCLISSNFQHSLGIDYTGQLWGWGSNNYGQLGINSVIDYCTPVSILGTKKTFCSIGGGTPHSISIDHQGQVWSWGRNNYGQLGINSVIDYCTPVSILGTKKTFCSISSGDYNISTIDYNGQVWTWGENSGGKLGNNSVVCYSTPVSICGAKKTFCSIGNGRNNVLGITHTGQVWNWGRNNYGQLGINSVIDYCTPVSILGTKKTFCYISAGDYHVIGIDYKGQVWGWGQNSYGKLGNNSTVDVSTPVSICGAKKTFCSIDGGFNHTIGIDYKGQVWGWGYNYYGQLGVYYDTKTPIMIIHI